MFKPLLSATIKTAEDLRKLKYPLIGSPKVDGIRCLLHNDMGPVTRKLLPIPNVHIRNMMGTVAHINLDGEIVVSNTQPSTMFDTQPENPMTAKDMFQKTQSGVMTHKGQPEFFFYAFDDIFDTSLPYVERHGKVIAKINVMAEGRPWLKVMPHRFIDSPEMAEEYEAELVEEGYEGLMLRDPHAPYKFGRSTLKQQILMKMKRFIDDEAKIVGFEELRRNNNEAVIDETGYQKRSSHKSGFIGGGTLGKFIVKNEQFGEFSIGSGLNDEIRAKVWADPEKYLGRVISFKYQPVGVKVKPRIPIFKGFRGD